MLVARADQLRTSGTLEPRYPDAGRQRVNVRWVTPLGDDTVSIR